VISQKSSVNHLKIRIYFLPLTHKKRATRSNISTLFSNGSLNSNRSNPGIGIPSNFTFLNKKSGDQKNDHRLNNRYFTRFHSTNALFNIHL